jgi:ParB family chromosome partitioning protein
MARALARRDPRARESDYAAQFESPEFLTLGVLYAKDGRFAGGAYSSFLKKVDRFGDRTLAASLRERDGYAARLREIDSQVRKVVKALEARGFKSPYLRTFVVARINPVRFHRAKPGDTKPAMPIAAALTRMTAAAKSFDVGKVRPADLALVAALSSE